MRVLCNYTYKNNGNHENFSITLEKTGDLRDDQVDGAIDELFAKAKAAVERQVNPEADIEFPPKEITIPKPRNNNNGNGKPQIRTPEAPATKKQRGLLGKLAKEKGMFIDGLNSLTMSEASQKIEELIGA